MKAPTGAVKGLIIAAPSSGSGKTVLTLGLLRYLSIIGKSITSAKAGPDYICLLYTSPSPRDATLSRMPSSA